MLIEQFMGKSERLSRTQFVRYHPEGALVFWPFAVNHGCAAKVDTDAPVKLRKTRLVVGKRGKKIKPEFGSASGYILTVKKSERNPFTPVSVGRAGNNDLILHDPAVSKFHAQILVLPSSWKLIDWNSTNGTFLNDRRLSPEKVVDIENGDKIAFGRDSMARFYSPEGLWRFVQLCRKLSRTG